MSGILQLNPPIYVETPLGSAVCMFLWEHGLEIDVQWCCFIESTGEPWWLPNNQIRLSTNLSAGRSKTSEIKPLPGLEKHIERCKARNSTEQQGE
ncbi:MULTISPECIES: hypothetical protein [unclassified Bradyrhizobium]|uniref:hypothetical protein n=1 Tax=unclassified Bradyrhizobium TaxID=2631580 RepID=UPI002479EAD6|nr:MULTISPECIES: hypothetical protein [unclassified Bradyrhizobium]WGR74300.1 hypothetical protein MTX24_16380 [Bradyrhizobium sp. ISRA426]WGR79135.1 hypothetical protein MTX21_01495 [Bradyrhizobium sp. ISRA430]WGR90623.1 hypothetical protein MTX25_39640 [Bradyrhizobium sp. ISRA432]